MYHRIDSWQVHLEYLPINRISIYLLHIGFAKGWKLTLVVLAISPLLFIAAVLFAKVCSSISDNELKKKMISILFDSLHPV